MLHHPAPMWRTEQIREQGKMCAYLSGRIALPALKNAASGTISWEDTPRTPLSHSMTLGCHKSHSLQAAVAKEQKQGIARNSFFQSSVPLITVTCFQGISF